MLGGTNGIVRSAKGTLLEGIAVQLVSQKNSIRTTVYTNQDGRYEFPKLETGWYTFRIARPLEYKPYQRDAVWIDGASSIDDVVLERVTDSEFLPPTPEILAQLTDAEWLYNLPGTVQEKKIFSDTCGSGCHNYHQSLRDRFDEKGWSLMLDRMTQYAGRLVIERNRPGPDGKIPLGFGLTYENREILLKFLARVRGPNSELPPMKPFPRPKGAATRVIITEYELPRFDVRVHDVAGDADGNIWYTSNRSPIIGKLDPRTGVVKEYAVPVTPGKHTGQHWLAIAKDGKIVFTETWSNNLGVLDPATGQVTKWAGTGGNKGLAPDGFVWGTCDGGYLCKFDPKISGKPIQKIPLKKSRDTYGNDVSEDGNYYVGGTPWQSNFDGIVWADLRTGEIWEVQTESGHADPSRGGIDLDGNGWNGGRGGRITEFERKTHQVREWESPTPFVTFYEAKPDKNGEIWAGAQRGGRMVRFNPKTERWIEYIFPEPFSLDWRTWVDNSTNPVTVWYGDHNGYILRLQPLE
jgi:virginiamycin B lyase